METGNQSTHKYKKCKTFRTWMMYKPHKPLRAGLPQHYKQVYPCSKCARSTKLCKCGTNTPFGSSYPEHHIPNLSSAKGGFLFHPLCCPAWPTLQNATCSARSPLGLLASLYIDIINKICVLQYYYSYYI